MNKGKRLKTVLRYAVLIFMILLASMGIAPITFNSREKFMDKEVRIEMVENADDEESEISLKEKS